MQEGQNTVFKFSSCFFPRTPPLIPHSLIANTPPASSDLEYLESALVFQTEIMTASCQVFLFVIPNIAFQSISPTKTLVQILISQLVYCDILCLLLLQACSNKEWYFQVIQSAAIQAPGPQSVFPNMKVKVSNCNNL